MVHRLASLAAVLLASVLAAPALGAPISVEFEGTVGPGSFVIPRELQGVVGLGDPVRGRFTYDTATPDSDRSSTRGLYVHRSPEFLLEVQLGGATISTNPADPELWIQILDDHRIGVAPNGIDRFDVLSRGQTVISPSSTIPGQLHIIMSDLTRSVFDSDALPLQPPPIGAFAPQGSPFAQGQVATLSGVTPQVFINFSVERWHVSPIPEPSSFVAFAIGIALIGVVVPRVHRAARARGER